MVKAIKDSGVEWIGDVSESWSVKEIGKIFKERNEKVSDYDYQPLSVTKNGIVLQLENAAKSDNHDNRKKVKKNDFVINSRSDRKMSSGLSDFEGSVSVINIVLHSEKVEPEFTKYVLKNYGFAEEFYRWGTGIVADLWSTRFERMKRISIPFPVSKAEQKKIANFLDEKTAHIDSIIVETKQSIEEFKKYKQALITEMVTKGLNPNVNMKDSGIEWIGEIPEHWEKTNLKRLATVNGRIGYRGYTTDDIVGVGEGPIVLSPSNIQDGRISYQKNTYISWDKFYESPEIIVKEHDIIFCKTGSTYGKSAILRGLQNSMTINPQLIVIRAEKIYPLFLNYYLQSILCIHQVETIVNGGAMPTISQEKILNMFVFSLPLKEQQQIVDYLDEKTTHIDSLIESKVNMISQLEEYKKSMIYEYVTGKKEVE